MFLKVYSLPSESQWPAIENGGENRTMKKGEEEQAGCEEVRQLCAIELFVIELGYGKEKVARGGTNANAGQALLPLGRLPLGGDDLLAPAVIKAGATKSMI